MPERFHRGEIQVVAAHLSATAVDAGEDLEDVFGALDGRGDYGDALLLPRETEALQTILNRVPRVLFGRKHEAVGQFRNNVIQCCY